MKSSSESFCMAVSVTHPLSCTRPFSIKASRGFKGTNQESSTMPRIKRDQMWKAARDTRRTSLALGRMRNKLAQTPHQFFQM